MFLLVALFDLYRLNKSLVFFFHVVFCFRALSYLLEFFLTEKGNLFNAALRAATRINNNMGISRFFSWEFPCSLYLQCVLFFYFYI